MLVCQLKNAFNFRILFLTVPLFTKKVSSMNIISFERMSVWQEKPGASIRQPCVADTGVAPTLNTWPGAPALVSTVQCTCGPAVMSRPCGGRLESTVAGASLQRRAGRGQGRGREQVWPSAAGARGMAGTEEGLEMKWEKLWQLAGVASYRHRGRGGEGLAEFLGSLTCMPVCGWGLGRKETIRQVIL